MQNSLATLDRLLTRLPRWQILAISTGGIAAVGAVDFLTGYEVSISFFYLAPVATASWYAGRRASVTVAALACISWIFADIGTGHVYHHPAIPFWNALIRFAIFAVNGLLVVTLRDSLFHHRELARTDPLTGILGRRAFEERLEHDLDLARRNQRPLTIAFVDLDDFKVLNDTRGHVVGDQALRATALALQGATRRTDTAARLGGDEFALVLPDTDRKRAGELVARLTSGLEDALGHVAPELTCSIGVITFEDAAPQLEEAVHAADALMYQAKREGKNTVAFRVAAASSREAVQPHAAAEVPRPARP
jgi:diguanylate cyclase (GGDEF)-like protein